jgi:hypothetical protein
MIPRTGRKTFRGATRSRTTGTSARTSPAKREAIRPPGMNILQQQARFAALRNEFNAERPHEALARQCPAARHSTSIRPYHGLPEIAYPLHDCEVLVTDCSLHRKRVNISSLLAGQKSTRAFGLPAFSITISATSTSGRSRLRPTLSILPGWVTGPSGPAGRGRPSTPACGLRSASWRHCAAPGEDHPCPHFTAGSIFLPTNLDYSTRLVTGDQRRSLVHIRTAFQ